MKKNKVTIKFKIFMGVILLVLTTALLSVVLSGSYFDNYYLYRTSSAMRDYSQPLKSAYGSGYEQLLSTLEDISQKDHLVYYVFDNINEEIIDSSLNLGRGMMGLGSLEIQSDLFDENDFYYEIGNNSRYGGDVLYGFMRIEQNLVVILQIPMAFINQSIDISKSYFMMIGLIVTLLALVFAYILSDYISKPVIRLNRRVDEMKNLKFSVYYEENRSDEIGELGENINLLSRALEETIGELQNTNEKLRVQMEVNEKTERDKSAFMAKVAHELKTPLSVIMSYAYGVKDHYERIDREKMDKYLDIIIDEVEKSDGLIMDMLSALKDGVISEELDIAEYDFDKQITEVTETFGPLIQSKRISLSLDLDHERINADRVMMSHVLRNLLDNAIKYCNEDGMITISLKKFKEGHRMLKIYNSGSTIPLEEQNDIWNPFYRLKGDKEDAVRGSGLGLSIVKSILNTHRFEYGVFNEDNGVSFWVKFIA